ncbi:MAG: excinuclease ABC subunit UvrA [Bacteroidota bacterium]
MKKNIEKYDPLDFIIIKGARTHNLKNVDVAIPRNKLVVITGLSGSGKSSLAFDTLYAEGQRRYVESLSAYARQFLGRHEKPPVDYIKGISPAIAIEQKVISKNPRSTVGTTTEIYDYLKLLFARIGKTYSPVSGKQVKRHKVSDVVDKILSLSNGNKVLILSRIFLLEKRTLKQQLNILRQQGFSRVLYNGEVRKIEEDEILKLKSNDQLYLLIDRVVLDEFTDKEETANRLSDSVQTAFYEGQGECVLNISDEKNNNEVISYTDRFEMDGIAFEEPDVNFFTFNNPIGACKKCEGFGSIIGIDPDLVIPNKNLSVYENAVVCWNGESMQEYKKYFIQKAHEYNFPVHKPIAELSKSQFDLLWNGNKKVSGIVDFFEYLESKSYKIQYRVMLARYRGKTSCPDCNGTRLRKDANNVKIAEKCLSELVLLPVNQLKLFFENLILDEHDATVAKRLLIEINSRIKFLCDVGLGYLNLNRVANTLSGGESQRINLSTSLGSSLVGSMYILDEPSIGLHSRDTERLIGVLKSLKELGNTVIIVEHDEDIMRNADELIDIGPEAGSHGGEIVFQGTHPDLKKEKKSLTAQYLNNQLKIEIPSLRRKSNVFIEFKAAQENNLKNLNVKFPLNSLSVVTGVSGSGKSTLVKKVILPHLKKHIEGYYNETQAKEFFSGNYKSIKQIEYVDQNPIGKSSRSNPVTYLKAYEEIRNLYADQSVSKMRGYKSSHFSFNVEGGRCEVCEGEGEITIEMQFMADIKMKCEECKGRRFKEETLEVSFKGKNISDILEMTVDDAMVFFRDEKENRIAKKIVEKLFPLQHVGLGYVQLGQSSSTLSGGEAQRIKLASFIAAGSKQEHTLFIFDEPTTGLHFHDIHKLLTAFSALLDNGHSLLVIEHNLDVIKSADWIIDLGPEGGEKGGNLVFQGFPEDLLKCTESYTGQYLKEKFK